ncbi:MAG TPA: helix-turn-helix domain-containing protein [Pseudonocardiaceae bacterium]
MNTTFGEELRRLRQQRGLSLNDLAQLVNYDPSYLSRLENGRRNATLNLAQACEAVLKSNGTLRPLVPTRDPRRRATGAPQPPVTGWLCPPSDGGEWSIAICGSRASGTDGPLIDACVRSVASLLTRLRCRVSHGPVGVGAEIMTFIADHYRPTGFDCVLGVVGRLNVVRPAEFIIVLGGGAGTDDEVGLACSMLKTVIPLPATGGAAWTAYRQMVDFDGRCGLLGTDISDLRGADAADYVQIVERVLRRKAHPPS